MKDTSLSFILLIKAGDVALDLRNETSITISPEEDGGKANDAALFYSVKGEYRREDYLPIDSLISLPAYGNYYSTMSISINDVIAPPTIKGKGRNSSQLVTFINKEKDSVDRPNITMEGTNLGAAVDIANNFGFSSHLQMSHRRMSPVDVQEVHVAKVLMRSKKKQPLYITVDFETHGNESGQFISSKPSRKVTLKEGVGKPLK